MATLERVLRELVRRHGSQIADEPVTGVLGELGESPGMFVLRGLRTISGGAELGAVLGHPQAQWRFDKRLRPAERTALLDDLAKWSRARSEAGRARLAHARETATASAEEELVTWARELGVEPLLSSPVAAIAPFVEGGPWVADTIRYFAGGDVKSAALGRTTAKSVMAAALTAAARRYLEH
nr:hypothetical protein [Myxococcota bacterium]